MSIPVGMGIDLVDLERVRNLGKDGLNAFAERICTPHEMTCCMRHRDPVPGIAARFAAKEAVSKALGTGIGTHCGFQDVEVALNESGAPRLVLHGKAADTANALGIDDWMISLTHSRLSAAAVVMGFRRAAF